MYDLKRWYDGPSGSPPLWDAPVGFSWRYASSARQRTACGLPVRTVVLAGWIGLIPMFTYADDPDAEPWWSQAAEDDGGLAWAMAKNWQRGDHTEHASRSDLTK